MNKILFVWYGSKANSWELTILLKMNGANYGFGDSMVLQFCFEFKLTKNSKDMIDFFGEK